MSCHFYSAKEKAWCSQKSLRIRRTVLAKADQT